MKSFKEKYEEAKANGLEERLRGDEISRRIGLVIPSNDQQALQTKVINAILEGKPLSATLQKQWQTYLTVRADKIAEVDAEINSFNKEG